MKFKRKKKRGLSQRTYRFWLSDEGYRITWRKKVFGVAVAPAFQACVRTIAPGNFEGGTAEIWDFVDHGQRLYRTMKAAAAACEQHHKLWSEATECTCVRAVQEMFGRKPSCIPKWVVTKLDRRVSAVLLDSTPGRKAALYDEEKEEPAEKKPAEKKPARKTAKKPAKKKPKPKKKVKK